MRACMAVIQFWRRLHSEGCEDILEPVSGIESFFGRMVARRRGSAFGREYEEIWGGVTTVAYLICTRWI
jgi:hypothetical protein